MRLDLYQAETARIAHDYMNIDMEQVLELVRDGGYRRLSEFLLAPVDSGNSN